MRGALAVALLAACSSPREGKYGVSMPQSPCDSLAAPAPDVFGDLVAPEGTCKAAPPATISRAEALADLDAVERVLRRGYAAFELQAMRGVSWDRLLREMRETIGTMKEPIASDMFGAWLADRLSETGDHTITVTAYDKAGSPHVESAGTRDAAYALDLVIDVRNRVVSAADPALVGKIVRDCKGTAERKAATATPEKATWRLIALANRAPAPATCSLEDDNRTATTATLPFHRVSVGGADSGPAFQQLGTSVPILRVRSLDEDNHPQELSTLSNTGARLFQQPAIVLDVRGVAPGSYRFDGLFEDLIPTLPSTESQTLWSEVIAQGDLNLAQCSPTEETDVASERDSLAKLAKEGHAERSWRRGRSARTRVGGRGPTRPYPGVFVMVVDAHCADACEDAVRMMRLLPRTILVGENTAGRGEVDEPRPYRLPHSRLWLTAGTTLRSYITTEGRGHVPDLWIDGDKPDGAIDAIARCAADAACARDIVTTR